MPTEWTERLSKLNEKLSVLAERRGEIRHYCILLPDDGPASIAAVQQMLLGDAPPVETWSLSLAGGYTLHQFLQGDEEMTHVLLEKLCGIRITLGFADDPNIRRLAKTRMVPANQRDRVCWMTLLYYLAWRRQHQILSAWLYQIQPDADDPGHFQINEWDDGEGEEGFDPKPYFTVGEQTERSLAEWRSRYEQIDASFPLGFVAFVTKDVVYASRNAILLLMTEKSDLAPPKPKVVRPRKGLVQRRKIELAKILLEEHGIGGNELKNKKPLTQSQLATRLQIGQGTLSKFLDRYLPGFKTTYSRMLETGELPRGLFRKNEDGSLTLDAIDPAAVDDESTN